MFLLLLSNFWFLFLHFQYWQWFTFQFTFQFHTVLATTVSISWWELKLPILNFEKCALFCTKLLLPKKDKSGCNSWCIIRRGCIHRQSSGFSTSPSEIQFLGSMLSPFIAIFLVALSCYMPWMLGDFSCRQFVALHYYITLLTLQVCGFSYQKECFFVYRWWVCCLLVILHIPNPDWCKMSWRWIYLYKIINPYSLL